MYSHVDFVSIYMFFHMQYSTEVAHNLQVGKAPKIFPVFEKIASLMKQKEKVQQLMEGLEDPPKEMLASTVILDSALSSSCKWVSEMFQ